jgi:hypothetical protein
MGKTSSKEGCHYLYQMPQTLPLGKKLPSAIRKNSPDLSPTHKCCGRSEHNNDSNYTVTQQKSSAFATVDLEKQILVAEHK